MLIYSGSVEKWQEGLSSFGRQIQVDLVGLCGHNEVVAMKVANLMGPPGNGNPSPLGDQSRVVPFGFGQIPYLVGEIKGKLKILELKHPVQLADTIFRD